MPPFEKSVEKDVYYGVHEEDNGMVCIGWRGPSAVTERFDLIGCSLLMKYFTDTSASPLQQQFVEIDSPYCSDVGFNLIENFISLLYLKFYNVPKDKISKINDLLVETLKKIAQSDAPIDMQRMNTVVHRHILETLSNIESSPHDYFACTIIGDFLFGRNKEDVSISLKIEEKKKKIL